VDAPKPPRAKRKSPIFIKSYEVVGWLLRHTRKFRRLRLRASAGSPGILPPEDQRFVTAKRLEDAALELVDALVIAGRAGDPAAQLRWLRAADDRLARLELYNRLACDLALHSFAQHEHLARGLDDARRLPAGVLS
jgi:hypothetical protein